MTDLTADRPQDDAHGGTDVLEADAPVVAAPAEAEDVAHADSVGDAEAATPEPAETAPAPAPAVEVASKLEDDDPDEPTPPADEGDGMQWYVLKVASNRETTIKRVLERDLKREALNDYFGEILIPTEKVKETKNGKTRIRNVKLWPGYLVVQMIVTDDTYSLVRGITGVGDFTGMTGVGEDRKPVPMTDEEVARLKGEETAEEKAEAAKDEVVVVKVPFDEGQRVKVKEGPFESFEGTVDAIDQHTGKIKILVEIFGRPTEMELEHWQVEKL